MKQYLLLLRSSDFNKSDNIWTSNPINVYHNNSYSNYSYVRSYGGLNLINDTTFVGTEVTSPSYSLDEATPIHPQSVYTTNYGEVIYEQATPSVLRFIDTTSRADILSYKHLFTNIPGTSNPTFNIEIWESDEENGPWLKSLIATDSNTLFIKNVKPYIKIQLEIYADEIDISTLGLVLYLELGIHEPVSPVISSSGKNILRRFPSWTSIFEDSVSSATPTLDVPSSTGGKLLTSLVQESLDKFQSKVDAYNINSYINSADESMLAWLYASYDVPANIVTIEGDSIQLARVGTITDLLECRETDYVFFYNAIERRVLTLRSFEYLSINGSQYKQEPENLFNDFDELGARVGLPRLYLESNLNYKKRILDVNNNLPGIDVGSLKRTLRRELDIWRAYGSTPDSDYIGATPEVLEISDIEAASPYFDSAGRPQQAFRDFVEKINSQYPANMGYVRWNEGVWDYAGVLGEGVGRIPAIHDTTPAYGEYYQAGVGDFDDARIEIFNSSGATVSFSGSMEIEGVKYDTSIRNAYAPVDVIYSWYTDYVKDVSDYGAGGKDSGLGVVVTYEIDLGAHDNYATPSTFYLNMNYLDRNDFYVGNYFGENSSASPEFNYIKLFNQDGLTLSNLPFRDKTYNTAYENTETTPNTSSINIEDAETIRIVFNTSWNQASQNYEVVSVADYRAAFSESTPNYVVNPLDEDTMEMASPDINYLNSNLLIGSTVYQTTPNQFVSDTLTGSIRINKTNAPGTDGIQDAQINIDDLLDYIIYPAGSTPNNLYINVSEVGPLRLYDSQNYLTAVGGTAQESIVVAGETSDVYIIPSSPNITYVMYDSNSSSIGFESYFDSATMNFASLPSYIKVSTNNDNVNYPFMSKDFVYFLETTTPDFVSGYIDENNNTYVDETEPKNYYINSDEYLDKFNIDRSSFGLDPSYKYLISSVKFQSTPNSVVIYPEDLITPSLLTSNLEDATPTDVHVYARKENESETFYKTGLKTGWLYYSNRDHYVYSNPITDESTGKYFSIELSEIPKSGAPVIAFVDAVEYRNIVFEDAATPGNTSFYNTETVVGNDSDSLYLSYEDIQDASVRDTYSGQTLFTNISSSTNVITPFDSSTPSVSGREYEVTYLVKNAFYVEKDVYDELTDTQKAIAYFSTTPDFNETYSITYESSYSSDYMEIDLDIDQSSNPLSEGYIYVARDKYPFSYIKTHLSPKYITTSVKDLMYLNIVSYDENDNLKPGQTFQITGSDINANPEYVTTNDNGYGYSVIRYSGSQTITSAADAVSTIDITGIGSATPGGGPHSSSEGYSSQEEFWIKNSNYFNLTIKASPVQVKIDADGTTDIQIVGKVFWNNLPFEHEIDIYWLKEETLYNLFNDTPTEIVQTDSTGTFVISGLITAGDRFNPNNWFVRLEVADEQQIIDALVEDGITATSSDILVAGDIVYWHEAYDYLHYANEPVPLSSSFNISRQENSNLISTPNFVYDHSRSETVLYYSATPNWEPPRWVPLRKFDQYQMSLLGPTPNYVLNIDRNHPDYGDL